MPVVEIIAAGAAATEALVTVIDKLNGARSVVIEVDNRTGATLRRVRHHHDHGGFAVTPSPEIPPGKADVYGSQNKGGSIATGTEGRVVYAADGAEIELFWVNPFVGDNESRGSVSGGHLAPFRVESITGAGNEHAHMRYEVLDRAQRAWRFCGKCHTLFFDGFPEKGACARDGAGHSAIGLEFSLTHDTPEPGQRDWRFCTKCHTMFFDGFPEKGRCPRDGAGHTATGFNFVLPHDVEGPGQDQWRFCGKCHSIFFDGSPEKGACAAGGGHEAAGFNFRLAHL